MAAAGLTSHQMALCLGISDSDWGRKKAFRKVREALQKGKTAADEQVEKAVFRLAVGYSAEEITEEEKLDRQGNPVLTRKRVIKELAPNPIAGIFYLTNRAPTRWRHKLDVDQTNREAVPVMSREERAELLTLAANVRRYLSKREPPAALPAAPAPGETSPGE
jgi:hypothetical protein